jgi:hypothetical protein
MNMGQNEICLMPSVSDSTSYIFLEIHSVLLERNVVDRQIGAQAQSASFLIILYILCIKPRKKHVSSVSCNLCILIFIFRYKVMFNLNFY